MGTGIESGNVGISLLISSLTPGDVQHLYEVLHDQNIHAYFL